jgi:hypothetical protein
LPGADFRLPVAGPAVASIAQYRECRCARQRAAGNEQPASFLPVVVYNPITEALTLEGLMTQRAVEQVKDRARTDAEYRRALETDPRPALAPYDLNIAEMTALMGLIASGALWGGEGAGGRGQGAEG